MGKKLGYDPADKPHKAVAWQDIIYPEDRDEALKLAQAHFEDPSTPYDQVVRYKHKDGSTVWIRCRGLAIRDEKGVPKRMLGAHIDVTKIYEKELQTQKALADYETIINAQSVYVVKIGLNGNYTYVNDFYCNDLGWDREDILGKSSTLDIIDEHIETCKEVGTKCFSSPGERFTAILVKERNGVKRIGSWEFVSLNDKQGNPIELLAIGHDVTEEYKQNEALKKKTDELQSFLDDAYDLIQSIDEEGNYTYVNNKWLSTLAYTKEEIQKLHFLDVVHPDERAHCMNIFELLKKNGPHALNTVFIAKTGNWVRVEGRITLSTDADGKLVTRGIFTDVTEVYKSEEELKVKQDYIETLLKNTAEGIYGIDLNGNCTFCNDAGLSFLGYETEYEVLGQNMHKLIHHSYPDGKHMPEKECHIYKAFKTGETTHINTEVLWRKDGSSFAAEYWSRPIIENGKITGAVVSFLDITERLKTEQELAVTQNILEQAGVAARIGAWQYDVINEINTWSRMTCKIMEVPSDYIPTPDDGISFYKEGYSRERITEVFQNCLKHGIPFDEELEIITAKGNEISIRAIGVGELYNNRVIKVYGTFQDITESRIAQRELERNRYFLEQTNLVARVGGWEYDVLKQKTVWTNSIRALHEVPMDYEPTLEKVMTFYTKESRDLLQSAIEKALSEGIGYDVELQIRTAKNRLIWVRALGSAEFVKGRCTRLYGTLQDVTVQKSNEARLKRAKEIAEEASLAKSEFLANMSHEIRTPLNSVIGFTDLLAKTQLNDTQQDYIAYVNNSANSLLDLINDILDFSKIEAGKLELVPEKIDLWDFFSHIVNVVKYKANEKNLELTLNTATDLPQYAIADPIRLRQVLINLLSNAIKFTERGEVILEIEITNIDANNEASILFAVQDTGIGIKKMQQTKIFEAFSQEDASTTRRFGGTGLGLSISNKLLKLMNSQLQLESEPGEGSRFFFEIKTKIEQGDVLSAIKNAYAIEQYRHVLIVDDNVINQHVLKEMLESEKIKSSSVSNGLEALSFLQQNKTDLVIIDYQMPFMDGMEVIKKIRNELGLDSKTLPIILFHSMVNDSELLLRCKKFDVQKVISKPITTLQLFNALTAIKTDSHASAKHLISEDLKGEKAKILIVDDNPINLILAKDMTLSILPKASILEAKNGKQAVDMFFELGASLILMDIQMPEMSGYEATEIIRKREKGRAVPIIALTAGTVKGEDQRCLEAGMNAYLSKPIVASRLKEALHKWLPAIEVSEEGDSYGESIYQHYNRNEFLERMGKGKEQTVQQILDLVRAGEFKGKIEEAIQLIRKQGDIVAIQSIAHAIKGASLNICFDRLAFLSEKLEQLRPFDYDEAEKLLAAIAKAHDHMLIEIED